MAIKSVSIRIEEEMLNLNLKMFHLINFITCYLTAQKKK